MRRSALRLTVLVALVVAAVVGTGGYSTVTLDRTVSVSLDGGQTPTELTACRNGSTVHVTVANRGGQTLRVRLVAGDVRRTTTVAAGDRRRVRLATAADSVTARLARDGTIVELTRSVTDACDV